MLLETFEFICTFVLIIHIIPFNRLYYRKFSVLVVGWFDDFLFDFYKSLLSSFWALATSKGVVHRFVTLRFVGCAAQSCGERLQS